MSGHIVKITLEDTHPPIWRRVILPEHMSFYSLHRVIQEIFGLEEEHLHEFTFPQPGLRIGDSGTDDDTLDERETDVDDFLMMGKWIRYTWDFGDDWRYKILYEKEEPEYEARYASVKKARGDGFWENSGGARDRETGSASFDIEAVNGRLKEMVFPVTESGKEVRNALAFYRDCNELQKMFQKIAKHPERRTKPKEERDKLCEMLNQWEAFYEKWKEFQTQEPPLEEDCYEQMVLPGMEVYEESAGRSRKSYGFEKRTAASDSGELLEELNQAQRDDYCRYLGISLEETAAKQRPAAIAACLREHPEYYLYVLDREGLEAVREFIAQPDGPVMTMPFHALYRAVSLGIVSFAVEKCGKQKLGVFTVAAGMPEIFDKLKEPLCEKTYQLLERVSQNISSYLLAYGLMELDCLYERYRKDFREKIEQEDFQRILYWHCRFNDFLSAGYLPDGQRGVASNQLDIDWILQGRLRYAEDLDYYPFSAGKLKEMQEVGCTALFPCWGALADYFISFFETEEESVTLLNECYAVVAEGGAVDDVLDVIAEWYEPTTIAEWVLLWQLLMEICLETGLPMLKGYSRTAYAKRMYQSPYELELFDEECLEDVVEAETPLFFMPSGIQQRVLEICRVADASLQIRQLEGLEREIGVENCDIRYLLAVSCIEAGKLGRAEKYVQSLHAAWPEDASINMLYDKLTEQFQRTAGYFEESGEAGQGLWGAADTTYRREERKVGRNEPCPCGSGRKYKHCCGKSK